MGSDKMTTQYVEEYLNYKISQNANEIIYTFYELRVKNNLSEEEIDEFLRLNKIRLENLGYKVYFTGAKFVYRNANRTVQSNEYMIAIKE